MQDYRNRVTDRETSRAVAFGCVGFMLMAGAGLAALMFAAAVTLIR